MSEVETNTVSAGIVVIGDEILSGRTRDINVQQIAEFLAPLGIGLKEVRIVSDDQDAIIEAVRALSDRCDYVFTTGGIGPTHDDITADAVAAAFGRSIDVRDDARAILEEWYAKAKTDITPARLRMARIPDGAVLIDNPVTGAPGFQLENVFVLAGVPKIARGMLEDVAPRLTRGAVTHSVTVRLENARPRRSAGPDADRLPRRVAGLLPLVSGSRGRLDHPRRGAGRARDGPGRAQGGGKRAASACRINRAGNHALIRWRPCLPSRAGHLTFWPEPALPALSTQGFQPDLRTAADVLRLYRPDHPQ